MRNAPDAVLGGAKNGFPGGAAPVAVDPVAEKTIAVDVNPVAAAETVETAGPRLRVLIDAFNRDLSQGTGISTYSRVLHDALGRLGHHPNWLFGRVAQTSSDPVASEVTFHDPPTSGVGLRRHMDAAGRLLNGLVRSRATADRLSFSGVVLGGESEPGLDGAFNVPGLYQSALYRHELLGRFSEVALPEPVDIFHLTSPLPISVPGARLVTSICDLVPLRLPKTTPDNKQRHLQLLRSCAQRSDVIVTLSEASKDDIVNILDVSPDKVEVTYLTSDMRELSRDEVKHMPRVLSRFGLEQEKYLLFVSAIEPKKNLRRLIEAYLEIDTDMPLVIVGRKAWMWEQEIGHLDEALGEAARKRLRFLGYASRPDLRFLYAGARALAFPSLYEGFGLPALEAMKMGCPVMTSDIAPLREVCGTAAAYADPYDTTSMRVQLERLIGDDRLRADLVQAGHVQAETFSTKKFLARMDRAYRKLA